MILSKVVGCACEIRTVFLREAQCQLRLTEAPTSYDHRLHSGTSRTFQHMRKVIWRLRVEAARTTRLYGNGLTVVLLVTTVSSTKYGICQINCN